MANIFVYGSCVSRDAFDPPVDGMQLIEYVARQSIISAFISTQELSLELGGIASKFQRRMVAGDLQGDLPARIEKHSSEVDAIIWDLTDERMGVLSFSNGSYVTPLQELLSTEDPVIEQGTHLYFGTAKHLELFTEAVSRFARWLSERELLSLTYLVKTPQSAKFSAGHGPTDSLVDIEEIQKRAEIWNRSAESYYDAAAKAGISVLVIPDCDVEIDRNHRWGVAPFHYSRRTYQAMLRALSGRISSFSPGDNIPSCEDISVSRDEYSDELKGLWPNGMSVSDAESGLVVRLPNGQEMCVLGEDDPVDWHQSFPLDHATSTLWMRSLIYLPLLEARGQYGLVDSVVASFADFLDASVKSPEFFRTNSLDHAVALALQTLCQLRVERMDRLGGESDTLMMRWYPLVRQLESLARSSEVYLPNNHGMFICVALLTSRWIWPDPEFRQTPLVDDLDRMFLLLDHSFSFEGVTVENTPHYQEIWIYLVAQAAFVSKHLDIVEARQELLALHSRLLTAFRLMLLPTGEVPAFGDGIRTNARLHAPSEGELYSRQVGLFVSHRGGDYFAFKCGAASPVHKHLDDTSIYLMVDGVELISDMGLLNYDAFDSRANLIRGQKGHSALAFEELDDVPQSFIYPAVGDAGAKCATSLRRVGDSVVVAGSARFLGEYQIDRSVEFQSARNFMIRDAATSRFGGVALQRFVVPGDASVVLQAGGAKIFRAGLTMAIRFDSECEGSKIAVTNSPLGDYIVVERRMDSNGLVHSARITVNEDGGVEHE